MSTEMISDFSSQVFIDSNVHDALHYALHYPISYAVPETLVRHLSLSEIYLIPMKLCRYVQFFTVSLSERLLLTHPGLGWRASCQIIRSATMGVDQIMSKDGGRIKII